MVLLVCSVLVTFQRQAGRDEVTTTSKADIDLGMGGGRPLAGSISAQFNGGAECRAASGPVSGGRGLLAATASAWPLTVPSTSIPIVSVPFEYTQDLSQYKL